MKAKIWNTRLGTRILTDLWPSLTLEEASRLMRGDYEIDGDTVIVKRTINKDIS